jgi:hypothetical protein
MKRLLIAAAAVLSLSACGDVGGGVQSANTVATKSVIAANDFYTHASRAGEDLVKAGLLDKAKYQAADASAYAVLMEVRAGRATFSALVAATAPLTGAK